MKKSVRLLSSHFRDTYHPVFFFSWMSMMVVLIVWRYGWHVNVRFPDHEARYLLGWMLYAVPFFLTIALCANREGRFKILSNPQFWAFSVLAIGVLFISRYFPFYKHLTAPLPTTDEYFANKVLFHLQSSFFYWLPPVMVWYLFSYRSKLLSFYGLTLKGFNPNPYLRILLVLAPIVILASFLPEFQKAYPFYKPPISQTLIAGMPRLLTVLLFEAAYMLQFLSLELFFRGFMVSVLSTFLGKAGVWPMVTVYMLLHFGKPMPEAIASIFGGYALGVLAWKTKNIFGGVMLHMGIALIMEAAGHLHRNL